jgi:hypothetical protein
LCENIDKVHKDKKNRMSTEKEELDLLLETYEATMVNGIGLRSRITEILVKECSDDEIFRRGIESRMKRATDMFVSSFKEQKNRC